MTPTPGHILLTLATPRVTGRACTHVYTLAHLDTKGCSKVAERTVAGNCTFEKKFECYSSIPFLFLFNINTLITFMLNGLMHKIFLSRNNIKYLVNFVVFQS